MRKLTLAIIGLTFASITGANASPLIAESVAITNFTNCTVDFVAINKCSSVLLDLESLRGWKTGGLIGPPPTGLLGFDSSATTFYIVKAAPTGTTKYYPASDECSRNPTVANLVCVKSRNGKCTQIKLECSIICPNCTLPIPPSGK